ncbi:hypothetical protein IAD21_06176 [Abditibacteriota bacterium]|nr:hypothetical protein IAD21_06176 [Abditibacteriota bacterium]
MGTLAFRTHDPATIAAQLEGKLRGETGGTTPIAYEIGAQNPSDGFRASEVFRSLVGGRSTPHLLFSLRFDFSQPCPTTLEVDLNKQHLTSYVGSLVFYTPIHKSVGTGVTLQAGKSPIFTGEAAVCSRLNSCADLTKSAGAFLNKSLTVGAQAIHIHPFLQIVPYQNASMVIAHTLPKSVNLGFGSIMNAKEWFSLLDKIKATL